MSDVVFVDSNILIYAHDADAGPKQERAVAILRELWESGSGRMSVQVLQEFYVTVSLVPTALGSANRRRRLR